MKNKKDLVIVTPVYNDWQSFYLLVEKLNHLSVNSEIIDNLKIYAINDCSSIEPDHNKLINNNISIIHLTNNVGHQKAIALGLAHIANEEKFDAVVVMDSDGEDKPEDVEKLLRESQKQPNKIIFAKRSKRSEAVLFKFFYRIYKYVFKLFTGKSISFGNFSIIPFSLLKKLTNISEIWNHYSSAIIRSKIPYSKVPTDRGKRLAGNSKMNFYSFVLHGLSAFSVQIELVSVRILSATFVLMMLTISGIIVTVGIRLFVDANLPGWATYVVLGLLTLLTQTFLISLILVFIILNYRTQKLFIPAKDFKDYILKVENID